MLLVKLDDPGPRARYAVNHLLGRMTGWPLRFAGSEEEFRSSSLPKVRYGEPDDEATVYTIHASGGLIPGRSDEPAVGTVEGFPVLFPSAHGHDPIAGAFFLLARSEEYGAHVRDTHGRLPSAEHFSVRHGFEQVPVVDHWAGKLAMDLRQRYPGLPPTTAQYRHVLTVDVDNGLMVLGRPAWKQAGAVARDALRGDVRQAMLRMRVIRGSAADPFDRYESLGDLARSGAVDRLIVFMLMRGNGANDHASDPRHPVMARRLKAMDGALELGLHPSYRSTGDPRVMQGDLQALVELLGHPVRISRQHFLRWRLPETPRDLLGLGIKEDHTMGFADRPGFRCGTCTPFPWYDLGQERETDLMLWPFAAMDSALHDRMGLAPAEAAKVMGTLSDRVRAVKGTFVSVWHDRFLSGYGPWRGWPEAMQELVEKARP